MNRTVVEMLNRAAGGYGEKPYVLAKEEEGWVPKSYVQVRAEARALAISLLNLGVRKGDRAAIIAQGSPNWVVAEFGILFAGGTSVPLSIQLLPDEIPFRINHSGAKVIFTSSGTLEKVASIRDQLKNPVSLIFMETPGEVFARVCEEYALERGKDILLLSSLVDRGVQTLAEEEDRLKEIEQSIGEDDIVTISYTSGTTGDPKGIMLTQLNYYANCHDSIELFKVPENFSTLVILPCDHSFAHTVGIYAALVRGITVYFVDTRGGRMATLRNIPINLKEANPSFLLTVPALTGNFMKKIEDGVKKQGGLAAFLFRKGMECGVKYHGNGYQRPSLGKRLSNLFFYKVADFLVFKKIRMIFGNKIQFCVGGGALLDIKQQEFFYTLGVPIYQGYGLTEAAPVISSNTPEKHKLGSSGVIAPTVRCKIITLEGEEAAAGETGEVVVQGNNVMKGYYKNEKATEETIKDGWLYTGDLGYFDEDGFLVVVGRAKSLLIAEDGEKYSPEEIEEAIGNSSTLIHQVMLYNDQRRYTAAVVTLDRDKVEETIREMGLTSAKALLAAIRDSFFGFKENSVYRDRFPTRWLPSTFQILEEPFSVENKMINSTMKMVRYKITETHKETLEYMYGNEGCQLDNPKNVELLKKMFSLKD